MHADTQRTGILYRTYRNLPDQLTAFQINRRHGTERRLLAGDAQRRQETLAHCAIRRTFHRYDTHFDTAGIFSHFRSRYHVVSQTKAHVIDEHQAVIRIDRHAAPVHSAKRARILQGAVFTRRCKDTLMAHLFELNTAQQQVNRGGAPHIRFFQRFVADHRHADGVGLRRRVAFTFDVAGRDRAFFHFRHRFTRRAVKHEDHALLAGLHQYRRRTAFTVRQIVQQWLRRQVEIPQIVMGGLEMPAHFTGGGIDRND